jgi:hypothetical protein
MNHVILRSMNSVSSLGLVLISLAASSACNEKDSGPDHYSASGGEASGSGGMSPAGGHSGEGTGGEVVGSGGYVLDTSSGPCGQVVGDIDEMCPPGACALPQDLQCAEEQDSPHTIQTVSVGCGYLELTRQLGEGDSSTEIYNVEENRLVYYSSVGTRAIGCALPGRRAGAVPDCDDWTLECSAGGGGEAGGAGL